MPKKPPRKDAQTPALAPVPSSVMLLIPRVLRDFERRLTEELRARGMAHRPAHSAVMRNIHPDKGARITDIARRAGMTKQAIGLLVTSMEEAGLVERVPDPLDGRAKVVRMTPMAKARHPEVLGVLASIDREFEERVGPERYRVLEGILKDLLGWR